MKPEETNRLVRLHFPVLTGEVQQDTMETTKHNETIKTQQNTGEKRHNPMET